MSIETLFGYVAMALIAYTGKTIIDIYGKIRAIMEIIGNERRKIEELRALKEMARLVKDCKEESERIAREEARLEKEERKIREDLEKPAPKRFTRKPAAKK